MFINIVRIYDTQDTNFINLPMGIRLILKTINKEYKIELYDKTLKDDTGLSNIDYNIFRDTLKEAYHMGKYNNHLDISKLPLSHINKNLKNTFYRQIIVLVQVAYEEGKLGNLMNIQEKKTVGYRDDYVKK